MKTLEHYFFITSSHYCYSYSNFSETNRINVFFVGGRLGIFLSKGSLIHHLIPQNFHENVLLLLLTQLYYKIRKSCVLCVSKSCVNHSKHMCPFSLPAGWYCRYQYFGKKIPKNYISTIRIISTIKSIMINIYVFHISEFGDRGTSSVNLYFAIPLYMTNQCRVG